MQESDQQGAGTSVWMIFRIVGRECVVINYDVRDTRNSSNQNRLQPRFYAVQSCLMPSVSTELLLFLVSNSRQAVPSAWHMFRILKLEGCGSFQSTLDDKVSEDKSLAPQQTTGPSDLG